MAKIDFFLQNNKIKDFHKACERLTFVTYLNYLWNISYLCTKRIQKGQIKHYMDIFDYIIHKDIAKEQNPDLLSSYREAAELICTCWNRLDMKFIEPFLDENVVWNGGVPHKVINGKKNFLIFMSKVFDSLKYSRNSYKADVVMMKGEYYALVSVDGEYQDLAHFIEIENGLIKKIEITPSEAWWDRQFGDSSRFGVISQTTSHELATAVAAIEQYVKTEIGDKPIKWAREFDLRNSHCQLSFTCDGLSYDLLVEIDSEVQSKCRWIMKSEFDRLVAGCRENNHIPCILDIDEKGQFVRLSLTEKMDKTIQRLKNKGKTEWPFRQLFKTEEQLSRLIITKDKRVLLPDYNDMEIFMEPLVKAVFILFLKHSKGIAFKELPDYRDELLNIYKTLKPQGLSKRTIQSIDDVTNPVVSNSINEKCARIRAAFMKGIPESIAKYYYITGERGEPKKISLPRDLILWE